MYRVVLCSSNSSCSDRLPWNRKRVEDARSSRGLQAQFARGLVLKVCYLMFSQTNVDFTPNFCSFIASWHWITSIVIGWSVLNETFLYVLSSLVDLRKFWLQVRPFSTFGVLSPLKQRNTCWLEECGEDACHSARVAFSWRLDLPKRHCRWRPDLPKRRNCSLPEKVRVSYLLVKRTSRLVMHLSARKSQSAFFVPQLWTNIEDWTNETFSEFIHGPLGTIQKSFNTIDQTRLPTFTLKCWSR